MGRSAERVGELTAITQALVQQVVEQRLRPDAGGRRRWRDLVEHALRLDGPAQDDSVDILVNALLGDLRQLDARFMDQAEPAVGVSASAAGAAAGDLLLQQMRELAVRADQVQHGAIARFERMGTDRLRVDLAIIALLVGMVAVLAGLFLRAVIGPVRVLRTTITRMADGGIGPVVMPAGSSAELAELAGRFNAMTAQLASSRERLQTDAALRAGEQRLRELADALPHLMWAAQPDGRVDYYNRRWEPLLGYPPEPGSPWLDHLHQADRPSVEQQWTEALRSGRPFDGEFRLGRENRWRWHTGSITPLFDHSGHILRWLGTASDTDERKRIENDLRQSRDRAEVLHQLGLDLADELEPEPAGLRVITAAVRMTAAESGTLQVRLTGDGRHAWLCLRAGGSGEVLSATPGDAGGLPAHAGEAVRIDDLTSREGVGRWPAEGATGVTGSLLAVPVISRLGLTSGWLVCRHRELRSFSIADEQVLLGVAALAAIALDNTQLLANERAAKRQATARSAELARSNAELEQFAYVASHDLREPLRMISSFLGILDQQYGQQLDVRGRRFIANTMTAAERMRDLIHDLLEYSRVGVQQGPMERIAARAVVDAALEILAPETAAAQATIRIGDLPELRYRPAQLIQVFQNLIGNAVKFHGEAAPCVSLSAERIPTGWRFSVRDNGIGIEPQHHRRIFLMFQRLHGRDSYAGMGIGLCLCQKIVEAHGGAIGVEANPPAGSHFWFTVPDQQDAAEPSSSGAAAVPPAAG